MRYEVERNTGYDFLKQSYSTTYPNLHRYPATMLPQIGIKLFRDFGVEKTNLLDPYCGSGSSFASGLEYGIKHMMGFDINPLAVLISRAKFTKVDIKAIDRERMRLRNNVFDYIKDETNLDTLPVPNITNIDYWFSEAVIQNISVLRHFIYQISDENIRNIFLVPFSETVRECSYTRNKEFKLYRMKEAEVLQFNPDVIGVYFKKLYDTITIYSQIYFPKITDNTQITVSYSEFQSQKNRYSTILTSPPYGDSRTTVAYGQFSTLSNEWTGIDYARKIDAMLMGGKRSKYLYENGIIAEYIADIAQKDSRRALEVSTFYSDLEQSISRVASSVKHGGKIFYVVGNRTVKGVELPTDQFIAEKFEQHQCNHIITFKRALSNKAMPSKNSPTNQKGKTLNTMLFEYIVVSEKQNTK